ncbi:MAG: hypothetical protein ACE37M_11600 [Henriciella sp.]
MDHDENDITILIRKERDKEVSELQKMASAGASYDDFKALLKGRLDSQKTRTPELNPDALLGRWLQSEGFSDAISKLCENNAIFYNGLRRFAERQLKNDRDVSSDICRFLLLFELGVRSKPRLKRGKKPDNFRDHEIARTMSLLDEGTGLKLGTNESPKDEAQSIVNMMAELHGVSRNHVRTVWKNRKL